MTALELINELKKHNEDAPVYFKIKIASYPVVSVTREIVGLSDIVSLSWLDKDHQNG